jgi:hypothetical protein
MVETVKANGWSRFLKEYILITPAMGRVRDGIRDGIRDEVGIEVGDLPPT